MTTIELATDALSRNLGMILHHIADFSDADMLVRPVPGANHAAWQLGHLIVAESRMVNGVAPGAAPAAPEGYAEKFTSDTAKIDDASAFPNKAEIVANFQKAREATIAWANTLAPADLDKPTHERLRQFAPTIGHMLVLMPTHVAMHVGQIQVIRRKLGRPVMF